jgi:hypothetical protein
VKQILHDKLREGRAALLSRLDGLGEYDLRRPLTPTGTNLGLSPGVRAGRLYK